jgi:hypothetical protein
VNVIGPTIEIASIDERHRKSVLLEQLGTAMILRLAVDPLRLASGVLKRAVTVDRISPSSGDVRREEIWEIGWANLPDHLDRCEEIVLILNEQRITEDAAIGVMLLLIHELEGVVSPRVLPIGSSSDYTAHLPGKVESVEVTGIRIGSAGQSSSRLGEKRKKILRAGFVSVTTFQYGESEAAHSYLHFVTTESVTKGARPKRSRGRKGKKA